MYVHVHVYTCVHAFGHGYYAMLNFDEVLLLPWQHICTCIYVMYIMCIHVMGGVWEFVPAYVPTMNHNNIHVHV